MCNGGLSREESQDGGDTVGVPRDTSSQGRPNKESFVTLGSIRLRV